VLVTGVTLLGGIGLLPRDGPAADASVVPPAAERTPAPPVPSATVLAPTSDRQIDPAALPARSGHGRRVVFDLSAQRVWLVGAGRDVERTYLVSGSVTDNLRPGTYEVYSTSRWAVGIDDSGVMQYFVRFTRGARAAIGFHSIPTKNGRALQSTSQLGTPQSHGCIRQAMPDAEAMWDFAPVGTEVVVLA
jgi:hypothetical protein